MKVEYHLLYTQLLFEGYLRNGMIGPEQPQNTQPHKISHTNEIALVVQKHSQPSDQQSTFVS